MTLANSPRLARERVHEEVRPGQHSSHRVGVCQGGERAAKPDGGSEKSEIVATSLAHFAVRIFTPLHFFALGCE